MEALRVGQFLLRLDALLKAKPFRNFFWALLILEGLFAVWLSRPWVINDNSYYIALSDNLALGRYGTVGSVGFEPDAQRPPGYPALLWLLRHVLGLPILGVILLQLCAYLLAIYLLAQLLLRRGYNSSLLLVLATAYPAAIMYHTTIVAEGWTTLMLVLVLLVLETQPRTPRTYVMAGLISAIAAYFRSDLLPVPVFITVWAIACELRSHTTIRRSIALGMLPAVAAAVLLSPYALWNQKNFNWPLPTPRAGAVGTSIYLATWQEKLSNEELRAFYSSATTPRAEALGLANEVREVNRKLGVQELYPPFIPGNHTTNERRIKLTDLSMDLAFKRIRNDPLNYLNHVIKNSWRLWHSDASAYPATLPTSLSAPIQFASWIIFSLGVIGLAMSFIKIRSWPLSSAPAVILLSVPAVHVWLHTEARYTASVRPIMLLLAATTLCWLLKTLTSPVASKFGTEPTLQSEQQS